MRLAASTMSRDGDGRCLGLVLRINGEDYRTRLYPKSISAAHHRVDLTTNLMDQEASFRSDCTLQSRLPIGLIISRSFS